VAGVFEEEDGERGKGEGRGGEGVFVSMNIRKAIIKNEES
jgi:hypothetical protein